MKKAALQVIHDVIESVSGELVDVAAWDFDQLVRLLKHPNELFALIRAIEHSGSTTEYGRAEQRIRAQIIGEDEARRQVEKHTFLVAWYEEDIRRRIARGRNVDQNRVLIGNAQASLESSKRSLTELTEKK